MSNHFSADYLKSPGDDRRVVIEKTDLSFGADSRNRLAEAADPSADGDPDALLGNQPASLAQNAATRRCREDTSCGL